MFKAFIKGLADFKSWASGVRAAVATTLAQDKMEAYMLARVQGRFAPRGVTPTAQTSPDNDYWPSIAPTTLRSRKANRNAAQALVDTGELESSIEAYGSGSGFVIRVNPSSPAARYWKVQNFGGFTPNGYYVPARQFLGIGQGDVDDASNFLVRSLLEKIR